ncbi:MAG TPA: hypothetical protein PLW35_12950 [Verrucomicrobiota bacterium]|nr:hypothetical protein [Verrucomicrobiota bacterium]
MKTFNVQRSTYNVQLATFSQPAGFPTGSLYAPAGAQAQDYCP